jgi:hypothetical protein
MRYIWIFLLLFVCGCPAQPQIGSRCKQQTIVSPSSRPWKCERIRMLTTDRYEDEVTFIDPVPADKWRKAK